MTLRPAVFDRHILSLDVAGFAQSLAECADKRCRRRARRPGVEDADHRRRLLLRAACERPRGSGAAEERKKRPPPHLITSRLAQAPRFAIARVYHNRAPQWAASTAARFLYTARIA